ncbi:serine hydrolase domain-containing protein [Dactylosporangium sp. NPDC051485]|uniref:serine hydrolase domain-containing protein n=1 Tax=Dactylosporangium sp. NPDC051485 TaxID=3154846 RepID=UPI003418A1A2
MTPNPLPASSPAQQGVAAAGLQSFLDTVGKAPGIELHGLVVLRHGHVIVDAAWHPYRRDRVHQLYSLSKSFTGAAAGLAVAEGLLDLDAPVVSYCPEFAADVADGGSRSILVRHLASMTTGHTGDTWTRAVVTDPAEPVRGFLLQPPQRPPGSAFSYQQAASYVLAALVQRATGGPLTDYLRPRLFDPLGIEDARWERYAGRDLGFSGLYLTTGAVARLGQLHLRRGRWGERTLLPPEWVDEAARTQARTSGNGPDWQRGYGFQFWQSRFGYRGDGTYGQFCLVLPEQDAVVAITAGATDMQGLLDAVWAHLLPAFAPRSLDAGADDALGARLATLELPLPPTAGAPCPAPESWADATFTAAGRVCQPQPSLRRVTVTAQGDGWRVTLAEPSSRLDLTLGGGGWTTIEADAASRTPPCAVSGGWTGPETLAFDVVFLETPHRLAVTCSLRNRTFQAHWHTPPLGTGLLRDLRAPDT